ncbi:hypothetical protein McanMca71_000846 [Microsporum canis]
MDPSSATAGAAEADGPSSALATLELPPSLGPSFATASQASTQSEYTSTAAERSKVPKKPNKLASVYKIAQRAGHTVDPRLEALPTYFA